MRGVAFIALGALVGLGCGPEDPAEPAPEAAADARAVDDAAVDAAMIPLVDAGVGLDVDAGLADPPAPASDFVIELGLGAREFVAATTGDRAPLQRGCQGAQHVWISLRSPALAPGDHANVLRAVRVRDGAEVVPTHTLELPWEAGPAGAELVGVTLVMFDPVAVVGELVDLHAEVVAPDGRVGRAVLRIRVEWGPDAC